MKFSVRLLTIICYFLPFIFFLATCNGLELKIAYNKQEADKNILQADSLSTAVAVDSTQIGSASFSDTTSATVPADSIPAEVLSKDTAGDASKESFIHRIAIKAIRPTDSSLSAIGSIYYYKNLTGKIVIALSLLISLILLLVYNYLRSQKVKQYLLLVNILCVAVFIADSFISDVTLLWGSWTLLFLLLIQFLVEQKGSGKVG
jgi:hypothetical protein